MTTQLTTIKTTALTEDIGVEISAVDLERDSRDARFLDVLRKCLDKHLLVLIRGQQILPQTLTELAGRFGPLLDIRRVGGDAIHIPGHDMIKVISNETDAESGRPLGDGNCSPQIWHSDSTTWEVPTGHIAFYCRRSPQQSPPATRFMNMAKVYESLPAETKTRIAELRVMHHIFPRQIEADIARNAPSLPLEERRVGRIHPLVRRHIPTGNPVLYLPVRRDSLIVGWSEEDSRQLLEALWEHAERSSYFASVALERDDFVIWDNSATVHSRDGWPEDAARTMWHVSAEGEVPTPLYGRRAPNTIGMDHAKARAVVAPYLQTIGDP